MLKFYIKIYLGEGGRERERGKTEAVPLASGMPGSGENRALAMLDSFMLKAFDTMDLLIFISFIWGL